MKIIKHEEILYRELKIFLEFKGGSYKLNQENISEKELIEKIKIADRLITMKEKDIHNYNKIK